MRHDILGLQAFLSIAERGSFHAAAANLNLSQTALSHRIRKLEEDIGVPLLARTTRQVSLTPAGVELLPKARRLFEDMNAALDGLRAVARDAQERIAIACLPTLAIAGLPDALAAFHRQFPETHVRVFDNSASEIADRVQAGDAIFGITIIAANRWDLDVTPVVDEPFVLMARRDQPVAARPSLAWADIDDVPLVRISAETGNRVLLDDALGSRRDKLLWRFEVQRVASAVALVRAGLACAVVPRLALEPSLMPELAAIPLVTPAVSRPLGIIRRKGMPLDERSALLQSLVAAHVQRLCGHQ
ncbi:MAG: LysR substrate-binding domain-containing protein [Beijerinckiaceae bacterium]